jgi:hypothetical protein
MAEFCQSLQKTDSVLEETLGSGWLCFRPVSVEDSTRSRDNNFLYFPLNVFSLLVVYIIKIIKITKIIKSVHKVEKIT